MSLLEHLGCTLEIEINIMSQSIAKLRSARVSSQKARLVADQIRGKGVGEALDLLTFDLQLCL